MNHDLYDFNLEPPQEPAPERERDQPKEPEAWEKVLNERVPG